MRISLSGDSFIVIEDAAPIYSETLANFALDAAGLGIVLLVLPAGRTSWSYQVESLVAIFFDAKGNAFPEPGQFPWAGGAQIAANAAAICAARDARNAAAKAAADAAAQPPPFVPPPPPPVLDESLFDNLPRPTRAVLVLLGHYVGKTPIQVATDYHTSYTLHTTP